MENLKRNKTKSSFLKSKKNILTYGILGVFGIAAWIGFQSFQKKAEVQTYEYRWYALMPTSDSDPNNQTLASVNPISAPLSTDNTDCAQKDNAGDFCAVAIKFAPGTTNFTLPSTNLASSLSTHPDVSGIATSNTAVDADGDGYAQSPL